MQTLGFQILLAKQVLSQLSYCPDRSDRGKSTRPDGLAKPPRPAHATRYLSYCSAIRNWLIAASTAASAAAR